MNKKYIKVVSLSLLLILSFLMLPFKSVALALEAEIKQEQRMYQKSRQLMKKWM
jgi:hypothetical protein